VPSTSFNLDDDLLKFLDMETEERNLDNRSQTLRAILREEKKRKEK